MATVGVLLHGIRFRTIRAIRPIILRGHPTLVVHAFPGIAGDVAMAETTGQRLIQCAQIIHAPSPVRTSDGETAVLRLFRDRVFEHHHGRYLECAADCVGNVVAFNAQRRLFKPKSLRHIVHRIGTCAHIADTAHLAACQRLLGIVVGTVHKLFLVASAGYTDGDGRSTQSA